MRETAGTIFTIAAENRPVPGCTISNLSHTAGNDAILHFSMAAGTDISAETYEYPKLMLAMEGCGSIYTKEQITAITNGEFILLPRGIPVGVRTAEDFIYTELDFDKEAAMNPIIKEGDVFSLKDLIPVQGGRIVNMDLISDGHMKFVLMSFGEGTGLTEHAAPGEALIFALEGKGVIGYEGKEHPIEAGQQFKFAKNGKHWVKADGPFKMALLLTLE